MTFCDIFAESYYNESLRLLSVHLFICSSIRLFICTSKYFTNSLRQKGFIRKSLKPSLALRQKNDLFFV